MATSSDLPEQEKTCSMAPWEQHAAVVVMPRFSYNAASNLLKQPRAGFLITCTIRREKSATKESMDLLREYIGRPLEVIQAASDASAKSEAKACSISNETYIKIHHIKDNKPAHIYSVFTESISSSEVAHTETGSGSRTTGTFTGISTSVCTSEVPSKKKEMVVSLEHQNIQAGHGGSDCSTVVDYASQFSLVKLATNGIIFLSIPEGASTDTVAVLCKILVDLEAGRLKPLKWCHRILPVQATCSLNRENLYKITLKLVKDFLNRVNMSKEFSLQFAVASNWRGVNVNQANSDRVSGMSHNQTMLGKNECIEVVVEAVHEVTIQATVNLLEPQMVVIVELLPVAGLQSDTLCVVSVLPGELMSTKPRLCIRSLSLQASSSIPRKRKRLS
ncbi:hypothetical protein O6H91_02G117600 [Diphasiastrum complanatum]|uniref:Uncharacterized protein n=1 Tax=Diphasiastrum complanatum TaxID=34168 RepID=A0ACC2EJZ3_DIPCM|nr:hypothetical protein O6H91_02G117600 [Diphasiastrum complanatum]